MLPVSADVDACKMDDAVCLVEILYFPYEIMILRLSFHLSSLSGSCLGRLLVWEGGKYCNCDKDVCGCSQGENVRKSS